MCRFPKFISQWRDMLFQGPNKNACVNRSPKMDIYRGRVGTSRGGGRPPPSGKVPHPTPPGASPPRPLRPGQVAGAQGGARALFGGNFGPVLSRPREGVGIGELAFVGLAPGGFLLLGTPRNPGDHHKPCCSGWFWEGSELP